MCIRTTPLFDEMAGPQNIPKLSSPLDQLSDILRKKHKVDLDKLKKRQQHVVPPWWRTEDELKWCIVRREVVFDHDLCVNAFSKLTP
jgi:hypothetical protein